MITLVFKMVKKVLWAADLEFNNTLKELLIKEFKEDVSVTCIKGLKRAEVNK